jgi:hypothetical protein
MHRGLCKCAASFPFPLQAAAEAFDMTGGFLLRALVDALFVIAAENLRRATRRES